MLTANVADKRAMFKVVFFTQFSIFIMGYLNALALNTYDLGALITAQTGNIIWLGLNAASGYWGYFLENMGLFVGFMGGVVFAFYTQSIFSKKSTQFFWNWTFFVLPIALYPIVFQYVIPPFLSFTILGFSAGATLGFFRKAYHMEINTSMATGNARFLSLHFAQAFIKKNTKGSKAEIATFWIFFVAIFAFAFGAFVYAMFARVDAYLAVDINIGLGYYLGTERLTLGMGDIAYGRYLYPRFPATSTNVVRIFGLLLFCVVPYFFGPKNDGAKQH